MATFTFCTAGKQGAAAIGVGSAKNYSKYLLSDKHSERKAEELFGNLSDVVKITNTMTQKRTFCPAIIGFTLEEIRRLSELEIEEIGIEYAEHLAHPVGLSNMAYSIVKHTNNDTGKVDLHVTLAQQNLENGKHFECFISRRGDMKLLQDFSDKMQIEYKLDDPRDPLRSRLTGYSRKNIIMSINNKIEELYTEGIINNRDDIVDILGRIKGVKVVHESENYISIKVEGHKKNIRLKGSLYGVDVKPFGRAEQEATEGSRAREANTDERLAGYEARLSEGYKKRYGECIERGIFQPSIHTNHPFLPVNCGNISRIRGGHRRKHSKDIVKNVKFVNDLLRFDEITNVWLWSTFDTFAVRDLGNSLEIHSPSAWKAAAAIAAAKGWDGVELTCSTVADAEKARAAFEEFGIEVVRMVVDGEEIHPIEAPTPAIEEAEFDFY